MDLAEEGGSRAVREDAIDLSIGPDTVVVQAVLKGRGFSRAVKGGVELGFTH